jgi:hypothetical protein
VICCPLFCHLSQQCAEGEDWECIREAWLFVEGGEVSGGEGRDLPEANCLWWYMRMRAWTTGVDGG